MDMDKLNQPKKVLKVSELIELLKNQPQDMEVFLEGCDCVGECSGLEIEDKKRILLTRFD